MKQELKSIRVADRQDLPTIAAIHKSQFRTHLLGQYSITLLSAFYGEFLGKSVFQVHENAKSVDGFVLGGEAGRLSACKKVFVRRHLMRCLFETMVRPRVWRDGIGRGLMALTSSQPRSGQRKESPNASNICLLSIAVSAEAVGKGVAVALVEAFELAIRTCAAEYRLSVSKSNSRAVRFYQKMGFEIETESGDSLCFIKKLSGQPSQHAPV